MRAAKAGCHAPGAPDVTFDETRVYEIPPAVPDIDLRLQCPDTTAPPVAEPSGPPLADTVAPTLAALKLKGRKLHRRRQRGGRAQRPDRPLQEEVPQGQDAQAAN